MRNQPLQRGVLNAGPLNSSEGSVSGGFFEFFIVLNDRGVPERTLPPPDPPRGLPILSLSSISLVFALKKDQAGRE